MIIKKNISSLCYMLFSLFLVLGIIVATTFAAFSAKASAVGQIEFADNISVQTAQNGGAYGGRTQYTLTADYDHPSESGQTQIYGNIAGCYGNLYFDSAKTKKSPNINYKISGEGDAYIAFEMEFRFTPKNMEAYGNLKSNYRAWNIYPKFNSDFIPTPFTVDGINGEEYAFICNNANTISTALNGDKFIVTAPFLSETSTTYSKTYRMFVMNNVDGEMDMVKKRVTKNNDIIINMNKIVNELRFAFSYYDPNVAWNTPADFLVDGQLQVLFSCKAGIIRGYDNFEFLN